MEESPIFSFFNESWHPSVLYHQLFSCLKANITPSDPSGCHQPPLFCAKVQWKWYGIPFHTQNCNSPFPVSASTFSALVLHLHLWCSLPFFLITLLYTYIGLSYPQPVVRKCSCFLLWFSMLAFIWAFQKRSCVSTIPKSKLIYPSWTQGTALEQDTQWLTSQPRTYGVTLSESLNLIRLQLRELH